MPSIQLFSDETCNYYHASPHHFADDTKVVRRFCCLFGGRLPEPHASPTPSTSASISLW